MDHSKPDLRNFIDEVNQRVPTSSVVGQKVKLRKKGAEFTGLCPFHNEKSPSFFVNDAKGFYHCFGCGAHGDSIRFIQETQRLSFMEALEQVAQTAGLSVPQLTKSDIPPEKVGYRERLREVVVAAARYYRDQLLSEAGEHARNYLASRDISDASVKKFGLGYGPSNNQIVPHLESQGFTVGECIDAGLLIVPQENDKAPYPRFRERLMFPIFDNQSRVIGFGGRTLREDSAKYINCPETPLFVKGLNLYGMNFALKAKSKTSRVIVTEGYFDVIQLAQHGFQEAVAPMGTAITEDQLQILWRRWEEIVLCMDGDEAGINAAKRAIERALPLLNPERRLYIMLVSKGDDPDTFLRTKGAEAFGKLLADAPAVSDFLWDLHVSEITHPRPERLASLRAKLNSYTNTIADSVTREEFSHYFKAKFNQKFRAFTPGRSREKASVQASIPKMLINRLYVQECVLLRIIMLKPELLDELETEIMEMPIHDEALLSFRDALMDFYSSNRPSEELPDYLSTHEARSSWTPIYDESLSLHHRFVRQDSPLSAIKAAWMEVYSLYKNLQNLQNDLKSAINDLHNTMDPKAWERVKMLQEMAEALRVDGSSDI